MGINTSLQVERENSTQTKKHIQEIRSAGREEAYKTQPSSSRYKNGIPHDES